MFRCLKFSFNFFADIHANTLEVSSSRKLNHSTYLLYLHIHPCPVHVCLSQPPTTNVSFLRAFNIFFSSFFGIYIHIFKYHVCTSISWLFKIIVITFRLLIIKDEDFVVSHCPPSTHCPWIHWPSAWYQCPRGLPEVIGQRLHQHGRAMASRPDHAQLPWLLTLFVTTLEFIISSLFVFYMFVSNYSPNSLCKFLPNIFFKWQMFYQFNPPGDVYSRASEQLQTVHVLPRACWTGNIVTGLYFTLLMCCEPWFSWILCFILSLLNPLLWWERAFMSAHLSLSSSSPHTLLIVWLHKEFQHSPTYFQTQVTEF